MTAMYSECRFCNLEFYWTTCMVARATSDTRTQCPQRSAVRDLNNQSALNLSGNISDVINKNRTTAFNYWDNFSPEAKYFFQDLLHSLMRMLFLSLKGAISHLQPDNQHWIS